MGKAGQDVWFLIKPPAEHSSAPSAMAGTERQAASERYDTDAASISSGTMLEKKAR